MNLIVEIRKIKNLVVNLKKRFHKNSKPSLNDLDNKLSKYFNFKKGFFIEVGANDGYSQSNTYYLEKKKKWVGLLVEGIPELFDKCKKERKKSIVKNCALVSNDFKDSTVTMHYAHLMSVVDGSLKVIEDQNNQLKRGVNIQKLEGSYSVDVLARTLESILDNVKGLPIINFFSLDVEGYELNVLKGLNLSKYRPNYILVEARFFDEVNNFLEKHQYKIVEKMSSLDYLYKDSAL